MSETIEELISEETMEDFTEEVDINNVDNPSIDFNIEELYDSITPENNSAPSIAAWLVPILDHHKSRIIRLAKNAELGRINVRTLKDFKTNKKLPSYIASINTPQVMDGLPDLQGTWDDIHSQYQESLFKYVHFILLICTI
jgi:hypothetical protein